MLQIRPLRLFCTALCLLLLAITSPLSAQSWELVKEHDGITVYTRQEAGNSIKAYKATAYIQAPAERVFALIEDVNHTEWWDRSLSEIRVLAYDKNKSAQYYLVFDSPWPVADRDLFVDVKVTIDKVSGIYTVAAAPHAGAKPEREGRVRIRNYRQVWTVTPAGENSARVLLEGYVDPAGDIPAWFSNLLATQSPVNSILGVRRGMEIR